MWLVCAVIYVPSTSIPLFVIFPIVKKFTNITYKLRFLREKGVNFLKLLVIVDHYVILQIFHAVEMKTTVIVFYYKPKNTSGYFRTLAFYWKGFGLFYDKIMLSVVLTYHINSLPTLIENESGKLGLSQLC